jgi:hypothetical protein
MEWDINVGNFWGIRARATNLRRAAFAAQASSATEFDAD